MSVAELERPVLVANAEGLVDADTDEKELRYGLYVHRTAKAPRKELIRLGLCDELELVGELIEDARRREAFTEDDRVGLRDRWRGEWLISPFATGL